MSRFTSLLARGALTGAATLGISGWFSTGCKPKPPEKTPAVARTDIAYVPTPIGAPVKEFGRPFVTNLTIADLDRDGLPDVIYCEAQKNTVRWIRQAPRGVFTEQIIATDISGPANVVAADLNGSGRLDVLVAGMGQILPTNHRIGSIVLLENVDNRTFRKRIIEENIARVSDLRAANLSGHKDGKLDLIVGQFGYFQGETRWLRNLGNWRFESHTVNTLSGCIHTPVADFDGDGHVEFAALISQEFEEVHWFKNDGTGKLKPTLAWGSTNEDYGSSGLATADVNRDGKPDLIYTNGDGFDYGLNGARPWHGVQWLENIGTNRFVYHHVGAMPGAFAPCAADFNGDGAVDLLSVSCFADWADPNAVSMMAWINDGHQRFTPVVLARKPTHLVTAATGDMDGDGIPEIVTGGFHAFAPYDHMSSITLWRQKQGAAGPVTSRPAQTAGATSPASADAPAAQNGAPTGALMPLPNLADRNAVLREKLTTAYERARASTDVATVAELGRLYHANGFHPEAEACWRWLQQQQPREGKWAYYRADLRRIASDYTEYETLLNKTVEAAPDYAPAWLKLAEHHFKTDRLDVAQRGYERRLALVPQDPYARFGLARITLQRGQSEQARREVERLVQEFPGFATGRNLLAEMLSKAGDLEGAKQQRIAAAAATRFREAGDPWLEALHDYCFEPRRLGVLGTIDYQTRHGDMGRAYLERAVELAPNDAECVQLLADFYLKVGEPELARVFLEKAVHAIQPPVVMLWVNLAEAYRLLGRTDDALKCVQDGLRLLPESYQLHNELGAVLGDQRRLPEAAAAYREAVKRGPNDTDSNYSLGVTLLALGQRDEAMEYIKRSLAIQPSFPKALIMLGRLELEAGRLDEAAKYIKLLYQEHPEQELARQTMVIWYLRAGEAAMQSNPVQAQEHFRAGFAIDPNHPMLAMHLGTGLLLQGKPAEALAALETYHRLRPNEPQSALFLGQAYAQLGRREDAKRVLRVGEAAAIKAGNRETAAFCREILNQL